MVAFNDRNFLVASIPTHRRDVHLKKYVQKCLGLYISCALKASITRVQSWNSRSNGNCSLEKGKRKQKCPIYQKTKSSLYCRDVRVFISTVPHSD